MLTRDQAREFAARWLPAWSGNRPEHLASFYTEDIYYSDPGIPQGVRGREPLTAYFHKLLGQNPDWVWTQLEGIPMEGGFLNKWKAEIPVGPKTLEIIGVCFVQLDQKGLIRRNEVYFDRSELVAEIYALKRRAGSSQ
ncbi:MAG: nuclear transport factor 2 family protein [Nevskiales bacterium]